MATPISAFLSAGASLTPSPVMATICLLAWIALTSLSLCSGLARAKTSTSRTQSCSAASFIASISVPATEVLPSPMPSILTIAVAVILWSPVIIVRTGALRCCVSSHTKDDVKGRSQVG
jgi:hypothetical protein